MGNGFVAGAATAVGDANMAVSVGARSVTVDVGAAAAGGIGVGAGMQALRRSAYEIASKGVATAAARRNCWPEVMDIIYEPFTTKERME